MVVCCISSSLPLQASALSFDPNYIISDLDFFNEREMDADAIQRFLERKGSSLSTYTDIDIDGVKKRAADIIARAARTNGINPKILLVLLQKEQSLIENSSPSQYNLDWATGFARCDSCLASDPKISAYKGFVMQVEKAAWRKKYYTTNPEQFNFRAGLMRLVDGIPITPQNSSTAALYNYTPHLRGNFSFWKLWNKYFAKILPDGMIVQEDGEKDIWLIQRGKRRLFAKMSIFLSRFSPSQIVFVGKNDLSKYDIGSPIKFSQYSLLQSPKGAIFLFADDKKLGIPSKKIFKHIGFNPEEVMKVTQSDLDEIPTLGLISAADTNPMGTLIQDTKTGAVFHVVHAIKHPILEKSVLTTNFPYRTITKAKPKELQGYETGSPILFTDGTLVTSPTSQFMYIISNGEKRAFISKEVFESLGFQKENIIASNGRTLELHPDGPFIDIGNIETEEIPSFVTASEK